MSFDHVVWRGLPYSRGVKIGSDFQDKLPNDPVFGIYRDCCGLFSAEEVRLLEQIAVQFRGDWLEIGAHTGWCTAALLRTGCAVTAVDPGFANVEWLRRFYDNISASRGLNSSITIRAQRSCELFQEPAGALWTGCLIDGDHEAPHPLNDAIGCYDRLKSRGVIVLHDFRGGSIWDAGKYLIDQGMEWRVYPSVNMIFVAWRGRFVPPPDIHEGPDDWATHYGLPRWAE